MELFLTQPMPVVLPCIFSFEAITKKKTQKKTQANKLTKVVKAGLQLCFIFVLFDFCSCTLTNSTGSRHAYEGLFKNLRLRNDRYHYY